MGDRFALPKLLTSLVSVKVKEKKIDVGIQEMVEIGRIG